MRRGWLERLKTQGERIRYARQQAGLSLAQVASGIRLLTGSKASKSLIGQWERGGVNNPNNANMLALAQVTGFSVEWIVRGRGPERGVPASAKAAAAAAIDKQRLARAIAATGQALPDAFVRTVADLYDMLGDTPDIRDDVLARFAATLLSRV